MKPVDNIFSNGLCLISVRKQINDLVLLAITDFDKTTKVWCDLKNKKLIDSNFEINMIDSDYEIIHNMVSQESGI